MLYTIGEMLIDFIALQRVSELKQVTSFERVAGGAPANVAIAVSRLGEASHMITQLGNDVFGDYLIDVLRENNVGTKYVKQTTVASTGLAFVSVNEKGERDFSFYRNPAADLLLEAKDIHPNWFKAGDYLHFGSVDLAPSLIKEAHHQAISYVKEKGGLINFDPNVRLSLWHDANACRQAILEFLPLANVVKISDEELTFVTGIEEEDRALDALFVGDVDVVFYTKGSLGASVITKNKRLERAGYTVSVEDTTGSGDAFTGGYLYQLLSNTVTIENLVSFVENKCEYLLDFANGCGALTATKRGAINALPTLEEVEQFIKESKS